LTYADKYALALDVDVGDGELVRERHGGVLSTVVEWKVSISNDGKEGYGYVARN
jgi:hypothetical protein